jgi:hypothetical protein
MVLVGNSIRAFRALGRPIFALKADSKIFDEVLKPLLDASESIVRPVFNLDDNFLIQKKPKLTLIMSKSNRIPLLMQLKIFNVFISF